MTPRHNRARTFGEVCCCPLDVDVAVDAVSVPCYAVAKVDNHCHAASLMTATHLLEFMRTKGQKCYDEIVHMRGQREHVTLGQLFKEKDVDFRTLSVSQLAVRMRQHMFFRYLQRYYCQLFCEV